MLVNLSLSSGFGVSADSFGKKPSAAKRKRGSGDDGDSNDTPKKAARVTKKASTTVKPAAIRETPVKKAPATKKEPAVEKAPMPKKPSVKKEPKIKKEPATKSKVKKEEYDDSNDNIITMSGIYDITSHTASTTWYDYSLDLSLSNDPNHGVWWATFRWGAWDTIMRIQPNINLNLYGPCELSWRMRDLETGQLTFGRKCTGDIEFFPDQTLRGCLYDIPGTGAVEFEGARAPGPPVQDDLQHEWDDFVRQAYGR